MPLSEDGICIRVWGQSAEGSVKHMSNSVIIMHIRGPGQVNV